MKRYFIEREITEAEFKKQDEINRRIMQIKDPKEWLAAMADARIILVCDTEHPENWR